MNVVGGPSGLDNKTSTGTHKFRVLRQLQHCVDPISLWWMRRRRAYMEHRERCLVMWSPLWIENAHCYRKMHQNTQCPSRLRHCRTLQSRRIPNRLVLP